MVMQPTHDDRRSRALEMAVKYRAGATLREIGDFYGITRERVRQIMRCELGIRAHDGGRAQRARVKREAAAVRKDVRAMRKYGTTAAEFERIQGNLDALGKTPYLRYREQRANSVNRGIAWKLTFAEWWGVWEESGKWIERGRGSGYVMARHGDTGPYEIGNVKIINGRENQGEFIRRYWKQVRSGDRPLPVRAKRTRHGDRIEYPSHCKHGHELSGGNLYVSPKGVWNCRLCNRQATRRYYEKNKKVKCNA